MKIDVCCIAKMENRYIREWVEHYRKIGFDSVILIDNNDAGGERFDDSIGDYMKEGFVEVIDFRGKEKAQLEAYDYVYREIFDGDWIAFFDVDEFLFLPEHGNIHDFMASFDGMSTDVVKINWMCYGDCGKLYYEDKPVNERFDTPLPFDYSTGRVPNNFHTKCIVRKGCMGKGLSYCANPHVPVGNGLVYRKPSGEVTGSSPFEKYDFSRAYLKHFTTKTIQEFVETKMVRGVPDRSREDSRRDVNLDMFFGYNEKTEEKLKIAKGYK